MEVWCICIGVCVRTRVCVLCVCVYICVCVFLLMFALLSESVTSFETCFSVREALLREILMLMVV